MLTADGVLYLNIIPKKLAPSIPVQVRGWPFVYKIEEVTVVNEQRSFGFQDSDKAVILYHWDSLIEDISISLVVIIGVGILFENAYRVLFARSKYPFIMIMLNLASGSLLLLANIIPLYITQSVDLFTISFAERRYGWPCSCAVKLFVHEPLRETPLLNDLQLKHANQNKRFKFKYIPEGVTIPKVSFPSISNIISYEVSVPYLLIDTLCGLLIQLCIFRVCCLVAPCSGCSGPTDRGTEK